MKTKQGTIFLPVGSCNTQMDVVAYNKDGRYNLVNLAEASTKELEFLLEEIQALNGSIPTIRRIERALTIQKTLAQLGD